MIRSKEKGGETMKFWKKKVLIPLLVLMLITSTLVGCSSSDSGETADNEGANSQSVATGSEVAEEAAAGEADEVSDSDGEIITLDFLMCWNGAASQFPEDMENCPIAQELAKKTGVMLNVETITTSETEKLNTIFAAGDVPDIVNAPYWNTLPGGSGGAIKKAATEGLILELDPYIDKFPNVKRMMTEGISEAYRKYDVEHPDYGGKHYVIPQQTPRTDADVTHWAYNVWVRQDILEELGVDPESINTSEKLYELMKKIKAGNFVDINGNPVIVSGTWHNGWNYHDFLRSFSRGNVSGWRNFDGEITHWIFDPLEDEKVLFMRKLVSEGLFDPEAFTQTDTVAKEKIATGRVAVLNAHYLHLREFMTQTLYKTNPEMKYVPVGPFLNAEGEIYTAKESRGRTGSPVIFLGKNCKDPEKALGFIDYINSEEGLLLVTYGIEGVHHTIEDGRPRFTEKWQNIKLNDRTTFVNEGLVFGSNFIGADPRPSMWPEDDDPDYERAKEVTPLEFYDGISADFIARYYPKRQEYEEKTAALDYGKEFQRAVFAPSDEEALRIINEFRQKLLDAGLDDFIKYMQEECPKVENIVY